MSDPSKATLFLKPNEARRLRAGHLWVFSNEVDTGRSPLTAFEPGDTVRVCEASGRPVGVAYVNPHSLICARIMHRDPDQRLDRSLFVHRLKVARALRERLYAEPYYRWVFGDSDDLPGLVVDRYDDILVVQMTTAGMECRRDAVLDALDHVARPAVVILRNDAPVRELEGLPRYVETVRGDAPDTLTVCENALRFEVPLAGGQKTGWFFDHRDNRARLARYVTGREVLDMFSYVGAWGIQAAVAGATHVTCVDSAASVLPYVSANAETAGIADRVAVARGDAFEVLRELRAERRRFGVVILDPPAFIKRRKDRQRGLEAYRRLNQMAMQVLEHDGILATASCSGLLTRDDLLRLLARAARHLDRHVQVLEYGHQAPDHPVRPAMPETEYLKLAVARIYRA